jgi:hypothetical protein
MAQKISKETRDKMVDKIKSEGWSAYQSSK